MFITLDSGLIVMDNDERLLLSQQLLDSWNNNEEIIEMVTYSLKLNKDYFHYIIIIIK